MGMTTTENLYFAAYALTEGARLRRIVLSGSNGRGRSTAVFELESLDIEQLSTRYYESSAVVNLGAFRNQLEALRDRLFRALRENETQSETKRRRDDEALRQGRAGAAQEPR
jgi:hypothetical protein